MNREKGLSGTWVFQAFNTYPGHQITKVILLKKDLSGVFHLSINAFFGGKNLIAKSVCIIMEGL